WMQQFRPTILQSAARHNHRTLSGMDDRQLAVVLAAMLYLENNSALNDRPALGRAVTPLYEHLQTVVNSLGLGTNFSIRPSNLRPTIAIDLLNGRVPLPPNLDEDAAIYRPIQIAGSTLQARLRSTSLVNGWTPPLSL